MKAALLSLLCSLLLTACTSHSALSTAIDTIPPGIAREVSKAELAFARSMADRDIDAFRSFLAEDTLFFSGQKPIRGADAVVEAWRGFFDGEQAPFSWAHDQVEVLQGGRLAYSSGPVRYPAVQVIARFNSIWQRDAHGEWKVIFDKGCTACRLP